MMMMQNRGTLPFITFAAAIAFATTPGCSDITPGRWLGQIDVPDAGAMDVPADIPADDARDASQLDDTPSDLAETTDTDITDSGADDIIQPDAPDRDTCDDCASDDGPDAARQCTDSNDECIGKVALGECQRAVCNTVTGECSAAAMDDGDICSPGSCSTGWWTRPGKCAGGTCDTDQGSVKCDDEIDCTEDGCSATYGCSNTVRPDFCVISDVCRTRDEINDGDACLSCAPDRDPRAWSLKECPDWTACHDGKCTGEMLQVVDAHFWMGCNEFQPGCQADAQPPFEVFLSPYWMDRTEVTVAAYGECVAAQVCDEPDLCFPAGNFDVEGRENHPINCVQREDAATYCAWANKRLPTEAEWEFATRGLIERTYPWGNFPSPDCTLAVMNDPEGAGAGCGFDSTQEVCSRSPDGDGPFNLCDLAGNVAEWVSDYYDPDYYGTFTQYVVNPTGPEPGGDLGVVRGGSYLSDAEDLQVTRRSACSITEISGSGNGFRCARNVE